MYPIIHKNDWKFLVNLANQEFLTGEQTYFLLALRETENGNVGNEFNIKVVKNTDFMTQACIACDSIKVNEDRWQFFCKEIGHIEFYMFFALMGGPYRTGWHNQSNNHSYDRWVWLQKMSQYLKEIKNEFEPKRDEGLGTEVGFVNRPAEP